MQLVEISIPSDHAFERIVRHGASVVGGSVGLQDERLADMQLAVSEAVMNAIEHGNSGTRDLPVDVRFLLSSGRLYVSVVDQGGRMPDVPSSEAPVLEEKLEDEVPRGMGMFLIHQLSDGVALRSRNGRSEITMWFNLETAAPPAVSVE